MINFELFENFHGVIWVQPDGPNTTAYPVLCADSDGPDSPQGDISIKFCRDGAGNHVPINISQNTKSQVSLDVVAWKAKTRSWLQKQLARRFPFPMYFHHGFEGGRLDTFGNYDAGESIELAYITSKGAANYAKGRADENESAEKVEQTFSVGGVPSEGYYKMASETLADPDSEDQPLRDIALWCEQHPDGPLGAILEHFDRGQIVADDAGPGADTFYTANKGVTWATAAQQPFGAAEDICSVVRFEIDKDTIRTLVLIGTAGAGGAEIAWSDDNGATAWNSVLISAVVNEYGMHSGALFALDARHIWACTTDCNIYFSDDGGLTWTDQAAPAPAANEDLYYIHFVDENHGWAVGGFPTTPTGYLAHTKDGGQTWAMADAEPQVESCNWVAVRDSMHVWVGMDDGTIWFSNDWGEVWTQRTGFNFTNTGDGQFLKGSGLFLFICGHKTVSGDLIPIVWRSVNGGMDWEEYDMDDILVAVTYYGLNAMQIIGPNELIAVGEDLTTAAVSAVWHLKPAGVTW